MSEVEMIAALTRIPLTDDGWLDWHQASAEDTALATKLIEQSLKIVGDTVDGATSKRGGAVPYAERQSVVVHEDDPDRSDDLDKPHDRAVKGGRDARKDDLYSNAPKWIAGAARSYDQRRGSWPQHLENYVRTAVRMHLRRRTPEGMTDHGNLPTYDGTLEIIHEAGVFHLIERADEEIRGYLRAARQRKDHRGVAVLKAYWFEQKPQTEIAAELGIAESTVSERIDRFRRKLPHFRAAEQTLRIAKKISNGNDLSENDRSLWEASHIDGIRQQTKSPGNHQGIQHVYAEPLACVNGEIEKVCGTPGPNETVCLLPPDHGGPCAYWLDRPAHVSPYHKHGNPHHERLIDSQNVRWTIRSPLQLVTAKVKDAENWHLTRRLSVNPDQPPELYAVQDDELAEVMAAHRSPSPTTHIDAQIAIIPSSNKKWRPGRNYQEERGKHVVFRPVPKDGTKRQIAADPWRKEFPLDGHPESRTPREERSAVPWLVPGWTLDLSARNKPEPPKPAKAKQLFDTWSTQPNPQEFKFHSWNERFWQDRAAYYNTTPTWPRHKLKERASDQVKSQLVRLIQSQEPDRKLIEIDANVFVNTVSAKLLDLVPTTFGRTTTVKSVPYCETVKIEHFFPPGTAACLSSQVKRAPVTPRREWRRRSAEPASGNVIGWFDFLGATATLQPGKMSRKWWCWAFEPAPKAPAPIKHLAGEPMQDFRQAFAWPTYKQCDPDEYCRAIEQRLAGEISLNEMNSRIMTPARTVCGTASIFNAPTVTVKSQEIQNGRQTDQRVPGLHAAAA